MQLIKDGHRRSFGGLKKTENTSVWRNQEKSKLNVLSEMGLKSSREFDGPGR